jgi:MinD-like ATPase involved in chromosome partitioning or flagellar assembly
MENIRKVNEVELWEVFSQLKDQKDVSIADIANATGLPYTTVDSIYLSKMIIFIFGIDFNSI